MRFSNYILILGLFLIISCRGEDNLIDPTFRWPGISADSDSLIVKLEKGYIDMVPVDTMSWLLERLKKSSHDCSDGQQILSRYYYWMGRILSLIHI